MWRWGAWAVGVVTFLALVWIATLGGIDVVLNFWSIVLLVFGVLMSMRSGRAWKRGERPERHFTREVHPTIDVQGQAGSTSGLRAPGRAGRRVKPEELSPFWWTLYSVVVRAPVALGDIVLTLLWRWFGGAGGGGTAALWRGFQVDQVDSSDRVRSPEDEKF
jgi:predicted tellurium resistance membrane protein TerC